VSLIVAIGPRSIIKQEVILHALHKPPSLVLDCANAANTHVFHAYLPHAPFHEVYVMETELLYTFRDILKKFPHSMRFQTVVVTPFERLFTYHNEKENDAIHIQIWRMMYLLSERLDFVVGISAGSSQEKYAKKYAHKIIGGDKMGRTQWSQRVHTDVFATDLRNYAKALRNDDRELFNRMLDKGYRHIGTAGYASSMHAWAFLLLSIILEQEKRLKDLEDKYVPG
jgi:hypothetical protein